MKTLTSSKASSRPITTLVRERIAGSGERLWRLEDFRDLPFTAVAQVLSRLTRTGKLERLSKGVVAMGEAMDRAIQKLLDSPPLLPPSDRNRARIQADLELPASDSRPIVISTHNASFRRLSSGSICPSNCASMKRRIRAKIIAVDRPNISIPTAASMGASSLQRADSTMASSPSVV